MERGNKRRFLFSFLLMFTLATAIPQQVSAAEVETLTRQQEFTADSKDFEGCAQFEKDIISEGKQYELKDITYKVLKTDYLDKKEKMVEGESSLKETITENGLVYRLVESEKEEKVLSPERVQAVAAYDDYDYAVTAETVPGTKSVTVTDEATGESVEVACSFVGITIVGSTAVTEDMTITFENYDAAYYEYNGSFIPKNDDVPALAGYEGQLLAGVGAPEGSTITNIEWAGEPYHSEDGLYCRDAVATVQQPTQVYRAAYQGAIISPEKKVAVYKGTYEAPDKEGRVKYKVQATAFYEAQEKTSIPHMLTGVGIMLLLGASVCVLMILAKKKRKKEEEKEK